MHAIERRTILKSGLGVGFGAGLGAALGTAAHAKTPADTRGEKHADGQEAAPAGAKKPGAQRTLRKAAMIGMVGDGETVLEKFQILRDAGFEGVEIDSPSRTPIEDMIAAQEKTGIRAHGVVDSVHWRDWLNHPAQETRDKGRAALEQCVRDAKAVGATSVLLVPAVVNADNDYATAYSRSQAEIRKVLPLAEAAGVKIAVENVWNGFLLSPLEAAKYVDDLGSPAGAFHFDIGNVINFGWPEHWVRTLGRRIVKLHIKDFSRKQRDEQGLWKGFDVELGAGDAQWARTMNALDEVGYSTDPKGNWATAEVRGGDAARLRQVAEQMDRLFAM